MAEESRWSQVEGTVYSPHEYRRDDGWQLFHDRLTRGIPGGWVIRTPQAKIPPWGDDRNCELGTDSAAEAQAWADKLIGGNRGRDTGLRQVDARRLF